jgi:hypothetical protein
MSNFFELKVLSSRVHDPSPPRWFERAGATRLGEAKAGPEKDRLNRYRRPSGNLVVGVLENKRGQARL